MGTQSSGIWERPNTYPPQPRGGGVPGQPFQIRGRRPGRYRGLPETNCEVWFGFLGFFCFFRVTQSRVLRSFFSHSGVLKRQPGDFVGNKRVVHTASFAFGGRSAWYRIVAGPLAAEFDCFLRRRLSKPSSASPRSASRRPGRAAVGELRANVVCKLGLVSETQTPGVARALP
jgi:hypothetical protein